MRNRRRFSWLAVVVTGLALPSAVAIGAQAVSADNTATPAALDATIQIEPATVAGEQPTVRFAAHNPSARPVNVLARDLPGARQTRDILTVTRDGAAVSYRGRLVKHARPTAADYLRIAAGGTYAVTVDLAADYDLSRPGSYTVQWASAQIGARDQVTSADATAAPERTVSVQPASATFRSTTGVKSSAGATTDPRTGPSTRAAVPESGAATTAVSATFRSCSSSQQTQLLQALTDGAAYTNNASSWLAANPTGGGLYSTWFGAFDSTRYNRVRTTFAGISTEFANNAVSFDCSCTDPYMAYVYANDAYNIHICPGYWPAAAKGYDSKAGTLIHESSHFTVNGGTQDYVYGLNEGKSLAVSNPAQAVANADNIEHFAESLDTYTPPATTTRSPTTTTTTQPPATTTRPPTTTTQPPATTTRPPTTTTQSPVSGACSAAYSTVNSWPGGFQGSVTVKAGSSAINGWTVSWSLASGQSISQVWNGTLSVSGTAVTVKNVSYNGSLGAGATITFGFIGGGSPSTPTLTCSSP